MFVNKYVLANEIWQSKRWWKMLALGIFGRFYNSPNTYISINSYSYELLKSISIMKFMLTIIIMLDSMVLNDYDRMFWKHARLFCVFFSTIRISFLRQYKIINDEAIGFVFSAVKYSFQFNNINWPLRIVSSMFVDM